MPYKDLPGGGKIWEGPRTEREEMDLLRAINRVKRFPSANHRAALVRLPLESPQEPRQTPQEE
jgi:hypothetical protein